MTKLIVTSKLASKAQTAIRQAVRTALVLQRGDPLAYKIDAGRVLLTKARQAPIDEPCKSAVIPAQAGIQSLRVTAK